MRPCATSLIAGIERMERITASALEYLKGESRGEPMRRVDLSALLESECAEFEELGHDVAFVGEHGSPAHLPTGCARARGAQPDRQRNQVRRQRAWSHCGVRLASSTSWSPTTVPAFPRTSCSCAMEPFERLSDARDSDRGGFGLGLAIARAIAEGHEGQLMLAKNEPSGLVATIRLPAGRLT